MAPCTDWITSAEIDSEPDAADLDPSLLARAITDASEVLYRLSGRQYAGVCTDTVRPCRRRTSWSPGVGLWPSWWSWESSWGLCQCSGEFPCGCGGLSEITLGAYPIREIIEVRINGEVLDPSAYRVDNRRWLVRIDGGAWPSCQNLAADPLVDPDTFQVIDAYGQAPPESGISAARELAVEIARARTHKSNRLPERMQTLSVPGATYALLDPWLFLEKGLTGLYFVDLFLTSVNPKRLSRRPSVISPDIPRPVRRTGVLPGS